MASPKGYEGLEPNENPTAARAAVAALEAQIMASQEARRVELAAARAAELVEQGRHRAAIKEAELVAVGPAPSADWRDSIVLGGPPEPQREAGPPFDPRFARPRPLSACVGGVHDAIDHVDAHRLPREQGEQLPLTDAETSASDVEPPAREGLAGEDAKSDRCDGGHTEYVTDNVLPVNHRVLQEWWDWVNAEHAALGCNYEQCSLQAVATTCEAVDATDVYFIDRLLQAMNDDPDGCARDVYKRRGGEAWERWQAHWARRPSTSVAELEALRAYVDREWPCGRDDVRPDIGSHVQIILDRSQVFAGGDAAVYARQYVRSLPLGWNESIVISLAPDHHPIVCRWSEKRVTMATTRHWAASLPDLTEQAPSAKNSPTLGVRESWRRFHVLYDHDFGRVERVLIPASQPVSAHLSLAELAAPQTTTPASRIHATGIGPLDAALATGGIPTGARVVFQATTGSGKTVAMLEIAESFVAGGLRVCWIATGDDHREAIQARRRQRRGMSQAEALRSVDESSLDPGLMVFDGRKVSLEAVLSFADEIDLLIVDPITKVVTGCTSPDPVVRVGYALDLIEAAGVTTIMGVPTVRGASRRALNERGLGGQRVESGAHLLLELTRDGSNLTLSIGKSRFGGEGLEIPLTLDAARQLVTARKETCGAASTAVRVEDRIWTDVRSFIAERGPRSVRALTQGITGKAETIRAVVRERIASGDLVQEGKEVRLS